MRILIVHNYTQQRGGADEAAEQEAELLRKYGHEVRIYSRHNDEIIKFSTVKKVFFFFEPTWSRRTYREIELVLAEFNPDLVHFHSFFPLISPSAYYAIAEKNIPVVQTLHEYRLVCPTGWLFRDNKVCNDCMQHSLWKGIFYGCYHDSHIQTASVALMLSVHRFLKTWQNKVHTFITLTEFARTKFIEGGIPESKIVVRSNFLATDPTTCHGERKYALYVGRLSSEKGVVTLLQAWKSLTNIPLKIVGDGPLKSWIKTYIDKWSLSHIDLVGFVSLQEVIEHQRNAYFLVMPSIWYETFGRTIIEAYSTGTPVIASRLGAMTELVKDDETGILFNPGSSFDLAEKVEYAFSQPDRLAHWGENAHHRYVQEFSAEVAYKSLIKIYDNAQNQYLF
jgi:glycosyltransferase involved in cell wall biosynthesis